MILMPINIFAWLFAAAFAWVVISFIIKKIFGGALNILNEHAKERHSLVSAKLNKATPLQDQQYKEMVERQFDALGDLDITVKIKLLMQRSMDANNILSKPNIKSVLLKTISEIQESNKMTLLDEDVFTSDNTNVTQKYGIKFDGKKYHYKDFKYERLEDAVNYAKL